MENLTDTQIQEIIKDICQKEKETHNLETDIHVITTFEHFKEIIKDKKTKLSQKDFTSLIFAGGVSYEKEKEIIIYFNKYKKIKKINHRLFHTIFATYHELRHIYQFESSDFRYEKFMLDIRYKDEPNPNLAYIVNHDEYYFEIDADTYALGKTKEYISNNYPEKSEAIKGNLEQKEIQIKKNFAVHDPSDIIERYLYRLKIILKQEKKEKFDLNKVSPVFKIFLNDNLSYKSMAEIVNNEDFKKLDKKIIYAFFSSETFLETINKETLSEEQINILLESLEYTNNLYQQQAAILLEEKDTKEISNLKRLKTKISKLRLITRYVLKLFNHMSRIDYNNNHKENPLRTEKQRQEHIQTIPTRIEEFKEIKSQRSRRGYITINIFYILGLLLSITTIIYLTFK